MALHTFQGIFKIIYFGIGYHRALSFIIIFLFSRISFFFILSFYFNASHACFLRTLSYFSRIPDQFSQPKSLKCLSNLCSSKLLFLFWCPPEQDMPYSVSTTDAYGKSQTLQMQLEQLGCQMYISVPFILMVKLINICLFPTVSALSQGENLWQMPALVFRLSPLFLGR